VFVGRGRRPRLMTIDELVQRISTSADCLWDRHALPRTLEIIALSFNELLARLFEDGGSYGVLN
jgi:hypothetical protein